MHFISPQGITTQIKIIITSYGIRLMLVQLYEISKGRINYFYDFNAFNAVSF